MPPRREPRHRRVDEFDNNERGHANPMQDFVNMLTEAMQNRAPAAGNLPGNQLANFKDFKAVGPPEFKGTTDPIEAQTWVKEIEKAFIIARVAEEQKTAFATYLMKGEANFWWESNQTRAGAGVVAWTRFKELFFETYFSESTQARMEVKFLELKQDNMSVSEYAAKFNELARFAPHQVSTEARKARRFENGLKPGIFSKVAVLQINTFSALLEKAIIAEGGSEAVSRYHQEQKKKRTNEGGSSGGGNFNKRKWNDSNQSWRKSEENRKKSELCNVCGKKHSGVCLKGKGVCFNCGQEGHMSPNCPNPKKIQGCFLCGSPDHQIRNCPKKNAEKESNNKGTSGGKLMIKEPAQLGRPMARTFNMMVHDADAPKEKMTGKFKLII